MVDSPILKIPQLATTTSNKEDFINDIASILERSLNQEDAIDLSAANALLTKTEFTRAIIFDCTGHSVARILGVPYETTPADGVRLFMVKNSGTSAGAVTVQVDDDSASDTPRGTTVVVAIGDIVTLYTDGTDVEFVTKEPPIAGVLGVWASGVPANAEVVFKYVFTQAFTLPVALAGSYAEVITVPTAAATFDIHKNGGASLGTVNFALGVGTATFTFTVETAWAAGDDITIVNQATADATLAGLSLSLQGS